MCAAGGRAGLGRTGMQTVQGNGAGKQTGERVGGQRAGGETERKRPELRETRDSAGKRSGQADE